MQGTAAAQVITNNSHAGTATAPWTIDAAAGNDTVINNQSFVSINGGYGHDRIIVEANSGTEADGVTIRGGAGNDTIDVTQNTNTQGKRTKGVVYEFGTADGSNTIQGFNAEDTIVFDGFDSNAIQNITGNINIYGNYVVKAGSTYITIVKTAGEELGGTKLNLLQRNSGTVTELTAEVAAGTNLSTWLANMATPVKDSTGKTTHFEIPKKVLQNNAGTRTYYDSDYDNFTIDAAAGNDTITLETIRSASINGGAGHDYIILRGGTNISTVTTAIANEAAAIIAESTVTVVGSYGNDTIDASLDSATKLIDSAQATVRAAHVYEFNAESGRDVIVGYNENDTIKITDDTAAANIKGYFDSTGKYFVISVNNTAFINIQLSDYFKGGKKLNIVNKNGAAYDFSGVTDNAGFYYDTTNSAYYVPKMLMGTNYADTKVGTNRDQLALVNTDDNFTVQALNGNDIIKNSSASNVYIDAGAGNDTIYLMADETITVEGATAGSTENVHKYGQEVSVYGGKGDDVIYNEVFVTVGANGAADTIVQDDEAREGHVFIFGYADGNDSIHYFGDQDTIVVEQGSRLISTSVSGDDFIINVGVENTANTRVYGTITLVDYVKNIEDPDDPNLDRSLTLAEWNGSAYTTRVIEPPKVVMGTTGSDNLENTREAFEVQALGGNDTVTNSETAINSTILGGAGNDYIINRANSVYIDGGYGNDVVIIESEASGNIIEAGYGNDSIYAAEGGGGQTYVFGKGQGTNYILGFQAGDKIRFANDVTVATDVTSDVTIEGVVINIGAGANLTKVILKGELKTIPDDITTEAAIAAYKKNVANYKDLEKGTSIIYSVWDSANSKFEDTTYEVVGKIVGTNAADYTTNAATGAKSGVGDLVVKENESGYFVDAKAGNDRIKILGDNATVDAGLGNDTVIIGDSSTNPEGNYVIGGYGNDYIDATHASKTIFEYSNGHGNDSIIGFDAAQATIKITDADYRTSMTAEGFKVLVGDGSILLNGVNGGENIHIVDSEGTVTVATVDKVYYGTNAGETMKVDAVTALAENTTVYALNGNDSITVTSEANAAYVDAGAGNDLIEIQGGDKVTLVGGYGNDTFKSSYTAETGRVFVINSTGQGVDVINGLNAADTIIVDMPAGYSSLRSAVYDDDDYFVLTFGDGATKLRLKEAYASVGASETVTAYRKLGTSTKSFYIAYGSNEATEMKVPNVYYVEDETEKEFDDTYDEPVVIGDAADNRIIINGADYASINAGAGNDQIVIQAGDGATITGGKGNDEIEIVGQGTHFINYNAGDGNDTITGWNDNNILNITGFKPSALQTSMIGANGNVFALVLDGGNYITFADAKAGTIIKVSGTVVQNATYADKNIQYSSDGYAVVTVPKYILGTTQADTLTNTESDFRIDAGYGADTIYSAGERVSINAGYGNDTITAEGNYLTINGGANDDRIFVNNSTGSSINGGTGADYISLSADVYEATVNGGSEDDTIYANVEDNTFVYDTADTGNDVIYGFKKTDKLVITGTQVSVDAVTGNAVTTISDKGLAIHLVNGKTITLKGERIDPESTGDSYSDFRFLNSKDSFTIRTGANDNDTVAVVITDKKVGTPGVVFENTDDDAILNGTTIADTIKNSGDNVTINGSYGADTIFSTGQGVSIDGGVGNDQIYIGNAYAVRDSTAGNHQGETYIVTTVEGADGTNITVRGGAGNDTIWGNDNAQDTVQANIYQYYKGDGNDVIYGFGKNDILEIDVATRTVVTTINNTDGWFDGKIHKRQEVDGSSSDESPYVFKYLNRTDGTWSNYVEVTSETQTASTTVTVTQTDVRTYGSGQQWFVTGGGTLNDPSTWATGTGVQAIWTYDYNGKTYITTSTNHIESSTEVSNLWINPNAAAIDATETNTSASSGHGYSISGLVHSATNEVLYSYKDSADTDGTNLHYSTSTSVTVTTKKVENKYVFDANFDFNSANITDDDNITAGDDYAVGADKANNIRLYERKDASGNITYSVTQQHNGVATTESNYYLKQGKSLTNDSELTAEQISDLFTEDSAQAESGAQKVRYYVDVDGKTKYTTEDTVNLTYTTSSWYLKSSKSSSDDTDASVEANRVRNSTNYLIHKYYTAEDQDNYTYTTATSVDMTLTHTNLADDGNGNQLYLVAGETDSDVNATNKDTKTTTQRTNQAVYSYIDADGSTVKYIAENEHTVSNNASENQYKDGTGDQWYLKPNAEAASSDTAAASFNFDPVQRRIYTVNEPGGGKSYILGEVKNPEASNYFTLDDGSIANKQIYKYNDGTTNHYTLDENDETAVENNYTVTPVAGKYIEHGTATPDFSTVNNDTDLATVTGYTTNATDSTNLNTELIYYYDNEANKVVVAKGTLNVELAHLPVMIDGKVYSEDDPYKKDVVLRIGSGTVTIKDVQLSPEEDTYINVRVKNDDGTYDDVRILVPRKHQLSNTEGTASNPYENTVDRYEIVGTSTGNYISNSGEYVELNIGKGSNSINNSGQYDSISTGDYADTITNSGSYASIDAGAGLNVIEITEGGSYSTLKSGKDADTITNDAENVSINAGRGKNVITNNGAHVEIKTGDDADLITLNDANNVTVQTYDGNDTININGQGSGLFIEAGKGNDLILADDEGTRTYFYNKGDGNDTISGWKYTDNIKMMLTNGEEVVTSSSANGFVLSVVDKANTTTTLGSITLVDIKSDGTTELVAGGTAVKYAVFTDTTMLSAFSDDQFDQSIKIPSIKYAQNTALVVDTDVTAHLILGDATANTITNKGDNNVIDAEAQNDLIYNTGNNVSINAGAGNDTIMLSDDNGVTFADPYDVVIRGGAGNDAIYARSSGSHDNHSSKNSITYEYDLGDGNDTIYGFGSNDFINIKGGSYTTTVDANNNFIINVSSGTTVGSIMLYDYPADNDVLIQVYKEGEGFVVDPERENKVPHYVPVDANYHTVESAQDNAYVNGSSNADTITYSGSEASINAGGGADLINLPGSGADVKVIAGAGNDTIIVEDGEDHTAGIVYEFGNSDGNNLIVGFNSYDSIKYTGTGTWAANSSTTLVSANNSTLTTDVTLTFGTTRVTLKGYGEGGSASNTITVINSDGSVVEFAIGHMVLGSEGRDNLYSNAEKAEIQALGGNDIIENDTGGVNTKISAGNGADTITNSATEVSIDGGAGNDVIINSGSKSSIVGGSGNDAITLADGSENSTVVFGDGIDTVTNNDLTHGHVFVIDGTEGTAIIDGFSEHDTIKIVGDNIRLSQNAVPTNSYSGGYFRFTAGSTSVQLRATSADTGVVQGQAIKIFVNDTQTDTIVVPLVYTASSASPTVLSSTDDTNVNIDTTHQFGEKYFVTATSRAEQINNSKTKVTISAGSGDDTIDNKATASDTSIFGGAGNDYIINASDKVTIFGGAGNDYIKNTGTNTRYYFAANNGFNTIDGWTANDIIQFAGRESIAPSAMYFNKNYTQVSIATSDNNSLVITGQNGANLSSANFKVMYYGQTETSNLEATKIVVLDNTTPDGTSATPWEADKEGFQVNPQGGDDFITVKSKKVTVSGGSGNKTIKVDTIANITADDRVVINTGSGEDTVTNLADYTRILTGNGADTIFNSGTNVSISAGAGNDTVINSGTNVSIYGGAGNDYFKNESNAKSLFYFDNSTFNTTIENANAANDTLYFTNITTEDAAKSLVVSLSADKNAASISAGNGTVVFKGSNLTGSLPVKIAVNDRNKTLVDLSGDGALRTVVRLDDSAVEYTANSAQSLQTGSGNDTIEITSSKVSVTGGSGAKNVKVNISTDVGAVADRVILNLSSGADTIENNNSYTYINAGAGNDIIKSVGNKSNVSILGGAGNDEIDFKGSTSSISGGAGNDLITVQADSANVTVLGDAGTDAIAFYGKTSYVNGGAGADTITVASGAENSSIWGGDDNDIFIIASGAGGSDKENTIYGGAGNDSIKAENGGNNVFYYNATDSSGVDTISGFTATSDVIYYNGTLPTTITETQIKTGDTATATRLRFGTAQVVLEGVTTASTEIKFKDSSGTVKIWKLGDGTTDGAGSWKENSRVAERYNFVNNDIFEDESDTYTTDNANDLSSITNIGNGTYSAGNIENNNLTSLDQNTDNTFTGYGQDDKNNQ